MEIRLLREGDDRSRFRSSSSALEVFFRQYARQNQFRHHIGTTYVAVDGSRILGFTTVAPGEIEAERVTTTTRKRLPRYPLPILRLARMATDINFTGQGVGKALVRFVFGLAMKMSDELGCLGIVVDAKGESSSFWAGLGFIPLDVVEGASDAKPEPLPMFLPIGDIAAAANSTSP